MGIFLFSRACRQTFAGISLHDVQISTPALHRNKVLPVFVSSEFGCASNSNSVAVLCDEAPEEAPRVSFLKINTYLYTGTYIVCTVLVISYCYYWWCI